MSKASSRSVTAPEPWAGDVLGRQAHAEFLTKYLVARAMPADGPRSFTLALDAPWGQGKTFFVENWSRSLAADKQPGHPTFVFDAWAADYAADPVLAFMAALKKALDKEVAGSGLKARAQASLREELDSAMKSARRAILPASKAIAKAVVRKTTGVAVDEITAAFEADDETLSAEEAGESPVVSDTAHEAINKGLDSFFKAALESHSERASAIRDFRASIERTLTGLADSGKRRLPMFVFVDELDRCRPTFAIALLEGIKHLFGVRGTCFVVSTNLAQLSQAVRAVYGSGFDGYGYLKRFFDVDFALPYQRGNGFATLLLNEYGPSLPKAVDYGVTLNPNKPTERPDVFLLEWVAETFDLDLRSQRQVLEMATAAAAGISHTQTVHMMWLLTLCVLRHRGPAHLDALVALSPSDSAGLFEVFERAGGMPRPRSAMKLNRHDGLIAVDVNLRECCAVYHEASKQDLKVTFANYQSNSNLYDYPKNLLRELTKEASRLPRDKAHPSPLASYIELVRSAGQLAVDIEAPAAAAPVRFA